MSTAINPNPNFIGYYNHLESPLAIGVEGRPHEVQAGEPVTGPDGRLIPYSAILNDLVAANLLRKIPKDHPKFKNHDSLVAQRENVVVRNPKDYGEKPKANAMTKKPDDDLVTVVSSGKGGGVSEVDLPNGAKFVGDRGRTEIEYQGKRFPSVKALEAFIASKP